MSVAKQDYVDPLDQIYGITASEDVKKALSYRFNFFRGLALSLLFFQGIPYLLNFLEYRYIGYERIKQELNLSSDKEALAILLPRSVAGWGLVCLFVALAGILFTYLSARSPSVIYSRSYIPGSDLSSKLMNDDENPSVLRKLFHPRYAFFHGMLLQSFFQLGISLILGDLVLLYL